MVKLDDMLDENSNDIIVCFYEKVMMYNFLFVVSIVSIY